MKLNFKLILSLFALVIFAYGCDNGETDSSNKDDVTNPDTDNPNNPNDGDDDKPSGTSVTFTANISEMVSRVEGSVFQDGDNINVSAYDSADAIYGDNIAYSYKDNSFSALFPINYNDKTSELKFYAIYPSIIITTEKNVLYSVKYDQSSKENYALSNVLFAVTDITSDIKPQLDFEHLLTKVVVNVTSPDVNLEGLTISLNLTTSVNYDLTTMGYSIKGQPQSIKMYNNGNDSFKMIAPPQEIDLSVVFGSIKTSTGKTFDIYLDSIDELLPNSIYTINASIVDGTIIIENPVINDWDKVEIE